MSQRELLEWGCQCCQKEDAAAAVTNLELHFGGICCFLSAKDPESHFLMDLSMRKFLGLSGTYVQQLVTSFKRV